MTRGINDGQNLDPEFIDYIYDTIESEPITLEEDDKARIKAEGAQANSFRKKQDIFMKEAQGYAKRGAEKMKKIKEST
jgi:Sec7-like guanine-nucleotide exchange factor